MAERVYQMVETPPGPAPGFLADICRHPEDDVPRLIYADWLDDHGQAARGAFIRQQIAAGDEGTSSNVGAALIGTGASDCGLLGVGTAVVRRGFVAEVALPCAVLLNVAWMLFRAAPVERVVCRDKRPRWRAPSVYGWTEQSRTRGQHYVLPREIFRLIPRTTYFARTQGYRWYNGEEAAREALAAAALAYGRRAAWGPV